MSPAGNRAWRRTMRSRRKREVARLVFGPDTKARASLVSAPRGFLVAYWRRHKDSMHVEGGLRLCCLVPDRTQSPIPITPRSLVGMTMGARKRAAWYEALRSSHDGDGGPISNRKLRLCLRSALTVRVLAVTVPIEWRLEVRAKYRIGERLRPCAGCLRCRCRSAFDAWPELGEELAKDHPTCDGSGVILARKSK